MTKAFEKKIRLSGSVKTKDYFYVEEERNGRFGIFRCANWRFGTTAMFEPDAWELVKEL